MGTESRAADRRADLRAERINDRIARFGGLTQDTTAAELIDSGDPESYLAIVPKNLYEEGMRRAAADAESMGASVTYVTGMLRVRGTDGEYHSADAVYDPQRRSIIAKADSVAFEGEQLVDHEDYIQHDELFEAYPGLKYVSIRFKELPQGEKGYYSYSDGIVLNETLKNAPESTLIHEIQHVIQRLEGFSGGTSPEYWARKLENGFDSRTAEERRKGAQLQEQYEQMKADDPEFVHSMEELDAMTPTVPRGKVDLNTWEQVEADPPEWVRYDERIDQLEARYGDRVWDWYSLRDDIDRNARNGGRMPYDLYRDTAGEIEARDSEKRRALTAEQRRETAPDYGNEDTVFAEDGNNYAIGTTTSNKPFVEVEQDILAGVPEADWVKTVKENLKQKFPSGITVGNNEINIDKQSRKEMTFSRYMQRLYSTDPQLRADKLRATNNADEILQATTDWVNEGLNHPRKDNIRDFARGEVLLRVGGNDYTADVVVGMRANGSMVMYDVLNLQPTSFIAKETDAAITVNPSPGAGRSTASVSGNSIRQDAEKSQGKISTGEETAPDFSLAKSEDTEELTAANNLSEADLREALISGAITLSDESDTGSISIVYPKGAEHPDGTVSVSDIQKVIIIPEIGALL